MPDLRISTEWPSTLPLPFVEYRGSSDVATLHSPLSSGRLKARERFTKPYVRATFEWNFTETQYSAFLTFFLDTLGNGSGKFKIELRYPKNSALTEWVVRLLGALDVETTDEDANFRVRVSAQIIELTTVPDKADTVLNYFYVETDDSDGAPALLFQVQVDDTSGTVEPFVLS